MALMEAAAALACMVKFSSTRVVGLVLWVPCAPAPRVDVPLVPFFVLLVAPEGCSAPGVQVLMVVAEVTMHLIPGLWEMAVAVVRRAMLALAVAGRMDANLLKMVSAAVVAGVAM